MNKIALLVVAAAALFTTSVAAQQDIGKNAKVALVFDQQLPNVPGKSLRVVLVEYGPGGGSPSHRHPSSAFIYARVLEGAIRSKVNDASERTYQAGESWTELPGDHHQVSQNASTTAPAKLLGRLRGRHKRSRDRNSRQVVKSISGGFHCSRRGSTQDVKM